MPTLGLGIVVCQSGNIEFDFWGVFEQDCV